METIIDVLYFLNRVEFTNTWDSEEYSNFHNIRKVIVDEFTNFEPQKLLDLLNLFDHLRFDIVNRDDSGLLNVDSLRENIFQLVKDKQIELMRLINCKSEKSCEDVRYRVLSKAKKSFIYNLT